MIRGMRNLKSGEQRIPRVVHQTWPGDLSVDRYPQLSRVQSSWKNAGWEYRFYTDTDARNYINRNFPSRFLDAYDSLIPGAFKVRRL
jgi:mannosyltransferase OCH1-like enzyme